MILKIKIIIRHLSPNKTTTMLIQFLMQIIRFNINKIQKIYSTQIRFFCNKKLVQNKRNIINSIF